MCHYRRQLIRGVESAIAKFQLLQLLLDLQPVFSLRIDHNRKLSHHDKGGLQDDDRRALVSTNRSGAVEAQYTRGGSPGLPPEWVDGAEEIQYELTKIKQRVNELQALHHKHMNRPAFDDNMEEEHEIEIMTQQITKMFHHCQRSIQTIGNSSRARSAQEERITRNIMASLAANLQELSVAFRETQSTFLKRLKGREEREQQLFNSTSPSQPFMEETKCEGDVYDTGFTDAQLSEVVENTVLVEEREQEINNIVRSIADLNEVFRDLAALIVEQGTILDRIDYNIEQSSIRIEDGLKQLTKAEKYQKSSRKMLCIIVLAVIVVLLLVIYVGLKVGKR